MFLIHSKQLLLVVLLLFPSFGFSFSPITIKSFTTTKRIRTSKSLKPGEEDYYNNSNSNLPPSYLTSYPNNDNDDTGPASSSSNSNTYYDRDYYVVKQTPPLTINNYYNYNKDENNDNNNNNDFSNNNDLQRITLTRYLNNLVKEDPDLENLQSLFLSLQLACKTISNLVNRAGLVYGMDRRDEFLRRQQQKQQKKQQQGNATADTTTSSSTNETETASSYPNDGRFYSMKRLDELSTNVLRNALEYTGSVHMVTPQTSRKGEQPAEHQPGVILASALDSDYVAVLDPMDGSGNADASICTGTVFGIFETDKPPEKEEETTTKEEETKTEKIQKQKDNSTTTVSDSNDDDNDNSTTTSKDDDGKDEEEEEDLSFMMESNIAPADWIEKSVLQPASKMRAAGYCLYSSATVLVFTLGKDVMGFTLDPQLNEFVLTHPKLTIPSRGSVYSCNEANSEGWSPEFKSYLRALKTGNNRSRTRYAHRYVGSMVGDIHRTLLYGGIFAYPSDTLSHPRGNLQLLYKSAPLAFLVTCAGGKSITEEKTSTTTNGSYDLLQVRPERVHQKFPCYMGSPQDVDELESYLFSKKDT